MHPLVCLYAHTYAQMETMTCVLTMHPLVCLYAHTYAQMETMMCADHASTSVSLCAHTYAQMETMMCADHPVLHQVYNISGKRLQLKLERPIRCGKKHHKSQMT